MDYGKVVKVQGSMRTGVTGFDLKVNRCSAIASVSAESI